MARRTALDNSLVIGAGEEVRAEASRVNLLQLGFFGGGDARRQPSAGLVDCFAVGARGERNVVGFFVAAFDFEAGDADADELWDLVERVKIAGRKEVTRVAEGSLLAVDQHFVGQATGLRATGPGWRCVATPGFGTEKHWPE